MEGELFYREIVETIFDGVYVVDMERRIIYWNRSAWLITGYTTEEVVGAHCYDNLLIHVDDHGDNLCHGMCLLAATLRDGQPRESEVFLRHKLGHRVPVSVRVNALRDSQGTIVGAVEVFNASAGKVTALERIKELEGLVYVDTLTGLANRRFLELNLQAHFDEQSRFNWPFGMLFIDIDHFKAINDRHGHDVGDAVLRMVAKTLTGSSRSFDIVGRWGGDEFVVILVNITPDQLAGIANRYRVLVERSGFSLDAESIHVTVSIGGTIAQPGDTQDSLIKRADELMYRSKQAGRNRVMLKAAEAVAK